MRYDQDHKERTRVRVLSEAAKAIRANGPEGVGVAQIMSKAGLTHGGFYAHFKSKDDLIAQSIDAMFDQARGRFAAETEGKSPQDALRDYIDFYLSAAHRDARATGCPLTALATDLSRMKGISRDRYGKGVRGLSSALANLMRDLGLPDADALGRSALAELIGALSLSRAVADEAQSMQILKTSRENLKRRLGLEEGQ